MRRLKMMEHYGCGGCDTNGELGIGDCELNNFFPKTSKHTKTGEKSNSIE